MFQFQSQKSNFCILPQSIFETIEEDNKDNQ